MPLRFRKTIGIIPGVRLNISKGGVSASVGGRGATVNIGKKGATGTVGLPGSGFSYRKSLTPTGLELARKTRWSKWWLLAILVVAALGLFYARRSMPWLGSVVSKVAPAATVLHTGATVSAPTANCRSTPERGGAVVQKLAKGTAVTVVGKQGAWTQVTVGSATCWVSNRTIRRS